MLNIKLIRMDLLNKNIRNFSFEDIESFCKEGHREGVQLDYKEIFPSGFAKQFASFSNKRGGVVIIGVKENKVSGIPESWIGIDNTSKTVEQVHQSASNVDPLPSYDVAVTNERSGKAFVLVRIFEGDKTPYYIQNDGHLWVRTGSISNPIDIASPEEAKILYAKRDQAKLARDNYLESIKDVYLAYLKRADRERLLEIEKSKNDGSYAQGKFFEKKLGSSASILSITVMPFFPGKCFVHPRELIDRINDISFSSNYFTFPNPYLNGLKNIPDGYVTFMSNNSSGYVRSEQLRANCILCSKEDIVEGKKTSLSRIFAEIFGVLRATEKLSSILGYNGNFNMYISLDNAENIISDPLSVSNSGFSEFGFAPREMLKDKYDWDFEFDILSLRDSSRLLDLSHSIVDEISWSFGFKNVSKELIKEFIEKAIGYDLKLS